MDYIFEHIRYINFAIGSVVIIFMTASSIIRRDKLARRTRRVWFWFYILVLNFLYGTASNIHDHIRLNPPAYIYTIILIGLLVSMVWCPEDDDQLPPDDNSVSTRFVGWLDHHVKEYKEKKETP